MTTQSKRRNRVTSFVALAGVAAAGIVVSPTISEAAHSRVNPISCEVAFDNSGNGSFNMGYGGRFSVWDGIAQLACPIQDDSTLAKGDIQGIEVYTHDGTGAGNNYARAYVCATDRDMFDGGCLQGQDASGSGFKTLVLSTSQEIGWIQSSHRDEYYAMLKVYMRSDSAYSSTSQTLMGYTVHD